MSKARLVITAVTVENRPVAEVVADYGVARSRVYELLARYRAEGEAAFEPRSKRPHTSPGATPAAAVVRHDTISKAGNATLRVDGQRRHIGIGRAHAGTRVLLLVQDLHVRVVNAATGELLTELYIDPRRDYQPQNRNS